MTMRIVSLLAAILSLSVVSAREANPSNPQAEPGVPTTLARHLRELGFTHPDDMSASTRINAGCGSPKRPAKGRPPDPPRLQTRHRPPCTIVPFMRLPWRNLQKACMGRGCWD